MPHLLKVLPLLTQLTSGLHVAGLFGGEDQRVDRFTGALDQLDATREAVSARFSRKAVREKLMHSSITLAQAFGLERDCDMPDREARDKSDV